MFYDHINAQILVDSGTKRVICNFTPLTKASALAALDCTTVWPVEPFR